MALLDEISINADIVLRTNAHDDHTLSLNASFVPRSGGITQTKVFCHECARHLRHDEVRASAYPE